MMKEMGEVCIWAAVNIYVLFMSSLVALKLEQKSRWGVALCSGLRPGQMLRTCVHLAT
jgi:hypothetical protein